MRFALCNDRKTYVCSMPAITRSSPPTACAPASATTAACCHSELLFCTTSYYSRGLLATPLLTSLDHAGSSNWLTQLLSRLAWPWYQLTSASVITAAQLLDWPMRGWLLAPAGSLTAWGQRLLGSR